MSALSTLGGMALGIAIPFVTLLGVTSQPMALSLRAAAEQVASLAHGDGKAEVAVAFDGDGRIISSRLRRSTGSQRSDAAALDGAVELASLQQPQLVAGRTLVFRTDVAAEANTPAD